MGWADLLAQEETVTLPWVGGRSVALKGRWWKIEGKLPRNHGWHQFAVDGGKTAKWVGATEMDFSYEQGRKILRGYLVGDWLVPDSVHAIHNFDTLPPEAVQVHFVEDGLDRFDRVATLLTDAGFYIYLRPEFPQGPEGLVTVAYQDKAPSVTNIPGVTPALELAFRWEVWHRDEADKRRAELERIRLEQIALLEKEEQRRLLVERMGDGKGRRALAKVDFKAAAEAALAISGARLLDYRKSTQRNEMVVNYEFRGRRLQCVCDLDLNIVDAGICLTDHRTQEKGDRYFTLESITTAVSAALDQHKLVVWRHVEGDPGHNYDYEEDTGDF